MGSRASPDLFRPVGLEELRLVFASGMRAFPPRLAEQPIFCPVLNEGYARQIAREWNTTSAPFAGFVTRFAVDDAYAARFERKVVGGEEHEELWVPAEELEDFNAHLDGRIEVVEAFFGDAFSGDEPSHRFVALAGALDREDFPAVQKAIEADPAALFLDFPWWEQADFAPHGIDASTRDDLLVALRRSWAAEGHAATPLGCRPLKTMADVEALLPWGLHDAYVEGMTIDWLRARLVLTARVLINEAGDVDQRCEIEVTGLVYCVIDPPGYERTGAPTPKGLRIDAGEGWQPDAPSHASATVPEGAFAHWLFFQTWNSFMHVCGHGVSLRWLEDRPVADRA